MKTWWPAQSSEDVNDNIQTTEEVNNNIQPTEEVNDNIQPTEEVNNNIQPNEEVNDKIQPIDEVNDNTQSIDDVNFNTGHQWLLRVTDNENRSWRNKTSTTNCLRDAWERQKEGILLSSVQYLLKKNIDKSRCISNFWISQHCCPHCSKRFKFKSSFTKHLS